MEFIGTRVLRLKPKDVWKKLRRSKELVITTNGKPVGLLMAVDAEHLEEALLALRRARAEVAVARLRQDALAYGRDRLTTQDIEREIQAVRRSRRA